MCSCVVVACIVVHMIPSYAGMEAKLITFGDIFNLHLRISILGVWLHVPSIFPCTSCKLHQIHLIHVLRQFSISRNMMRVVVSTHRPFSPYFLFAFVLTSLNFKLFSVTCWPHAANKQPSPIGFTCNGYARCDSKPKMFEPNAI